MSKLSDLMRDSISAEKQNLEKSSVEISENIASKYEIYNNLDLGIIKHYYEMYAAIIRSQTKLFELIQKEQVSITENTIASSFAILSSFKTGFKSLQSRISN